VLPSSSATPPHPCVMGCVGAAHCGVIVGIPATGPALARLHAWACLSVSSCICNGVWSGPGPTLVAVPAESAVHHGSTPGFMLCRCCSQFLGVYPLQSSRKDWKSANGLQTNEWWACAAHPLVVLLCSAHGMQLCKACAVSRCWVCLVSRVSSWAQCSGLLPPVCTQGCQVWGPTR